MGIYVFLRDDFFCLVFKLETSDLLYKDNIRMP